MVFKIKKLEFIFRDKMLHGLFCIHWNGDGIYSFWTLHFVCRTSTAWGNYKTGKKKFLWGYEETWYDGPWKFFGLGPLMLFAWR